MASGIVAVANGSGCGAVMGGSVDEGMVGGDESGGDDDASADVSWALGFLPVRGRRGASKQELCIPCFVHLLHDA